MAPHYADDRVTLYAGDCLDVLAELPDASVDAVCTDPPYGLGFMGKAWDTPRMLGQDNAPSGGGSNYFKRKGDDGYTSGNAAWYGHNDPRAFGAWCSLWTAECLRVLKPGGHLLAFGGTRTWHRLACAVEDAGFEVRDSIAWMYGSGFPKSLDVSKAIDKMDAGAERRARNLRFTEWLRSTGVTSRQIDVATSSFMGGHYLTSREQAAVPTADMFDLIRPLINADVPEWVEALVRERTVESENYKAREVLGTERRANEPSGIVGIGQGERVMFDRKITAAHTPEAEQWQGWGTALKPAFEPIVVARKPLVGTVAANVLEHGTGALNIDGCRIEGAPDPASRAAQRSAIDTSDGRLGQKAANIEAMNAGLIAPPSGRWPANVILDESQADALDEQSGELTSGANPTRRGSDKFRDAYGDFAGQEECVAHRGADSGGASRFFYVAKADASERVRVNGTAHPTVKPLALMRWLVRLVTPPGGVVLEPFAGSGTTVEAALLEGFRCIAIEREADYLPLIEQRINRRRDPVAAVKASGEDNGLFDLLDGEAS